MKINYPKEPNANSTDKIKISKDGTQLNKVDIKSKRSLPNGHIRITTQHSGKDNGKKAMIKNIYVIGIADFIIRNQDCAVEKIQQQVDELNQLFTQQAQNKLKLLK